jgi:hypothetical protein
METVCCSQKRQQNRNSNNSTPSRIIEHALDGVMLSCCRRQKNQKLSHHAGQALPPLLVFSNGFCPQRRVNLVKLSPEDIAISSGERVRPQLNRDEASDKLNEVSGDKRKSIVINND